MEGNQKNTNKMMEINWAQQKVLSNPLRSRLVALLYEKPMTPKQVADLVGKNPGTVYYHIQQLLKHDILEIDRTDTEKGVVEKYYRAKAVIFRNPDTVSSAGDVDNKTANIYLSSKLRDQLSKEIEELFFKYGHLSFNEKDDEEQLPYKLEFLIKQSSREENE